MAFEIRTVDQIQFQLSDELVSASTDRVKQPTVQDELEEHVSDVRGSVRDVVDQFLKQKINRSEPSSQATQKEIFESSAKLFSFEEKVSSGPVAEFVCEDDVRQALVNKNKIVVNSNTIITPSARDLGSEKNVFVWES